MLVTPTAASNAPAPWAGVGRPGVAAGEGIDTAPKAFRPADIGPIGPAAVVHTASSKSVSGMLSRQVVQRSGNPARAGGPQYSEPAAAR